MAYLCAALVTSLRDRSAACAGPLPADQGRGNRRGPSWPMATQPRPEYKRRGKARTDTATSLARLRIRLRAAVGVNARADVHADLLAA